MNKFLLAFLILASTKLWAQAQHPVDFDESFFRKNPYSRWMRDPFRNPPGFAKSALEKIKWPKLTSVVKSETSNYAVLDGIKYLEGQFIDDTRYVSAIGENYVVISEGNFDYELVMPDPKRNLATESGEKK